MPRVAPLPGMRDSRVKPLPEVRRRENPHASLRDFKLFIEAEEERLQQELGSGGKAIGSRLWQILRRDGWKLVSVQRNYLINRVRYYSQRSRYNPFGVKQWQQNVKDRYRDYNKAEMTEELSSVMDQHGLKKDSPKLLKMLQHLRKYWLRPEAQKVLKAWTTRAKSKDLKEQKAVLKLFKKVGKERVCAWLKEFCRGATSTKPAKQSKQRRVKRIQIEEPERRTVTVNKRPGAKILGPKGTKAQAKTKKTKVDQSQGPKKTKHGYTFEDDWIDDDDDTGRDIMSKMATRGKHNFYDFKVLENVNMPQDDARMEQIRKEMDNNYYNLKGHTYQPFHLGAPPIPVPPQAAPLPLLAPTLAASRGGEIVNIMTVRKKPKKITPVLLP